MERPRLGKGQNYHHIWWTARNYNYQDELQERFRENKNFVFPMIKDVHISLHEDIGPPPKPSRYQMYAILGDMALFRPEGRADKIYRAIDTLNILSRIDGEPSENALKIAEHLESQLIYLEEGNPDVA
jgi:hypothetical protein